ncbi:MAG: serine--tRNA ligase, partial [Candidatus Diapherotrites archaeon]|nr:serine--tRNA ligase [Candidatus Diapherotrites archaeon]
VLAIDEEWRAVLQKEDALRNERNNNNMEIAQLKKKGENADGKIKRMKEISTEITQLDKDKQTLREKRDEKLYVIGNILHESVPDGAGEKENKVIKTWGDIKKPTFKLKSHVDLLTSLDIADMEKASQVSGARFYYLKNDLVTLNLAIQQFALQHLIKKGFTPMYTPFFLREEVMAAAAELGDFRETLYKIQDEDLFMIATSEQTLAAYHYDEILAEDDLPLKYAGVSSCFRREAGAHGKDTKGIFRVHKFDKVEQFVYAHPDKSWELHEELLQNAEEIIQALEIPYRVVNICAGDMNDNAAKKYDIETWAPVQGTYREIGSISNCTDYQPRKLKVRARKAPGEPTYTIHTLNGTAIPTTRAIVAILENFQQEDGSVKIPKVLQQYTGKKEITPK